MNGSPGWNIMTMFLAFLSCKTFGMSMMLLTQEPHEEQQAPLSAFDHSWRWRCFSEV